jgi:hypothetical protein
VPRKLPEPLEPQPGESPAAFASRQAVSKRRLQLFKRTYQNFHLWKALIEAGDAQDILTVDGEDIYIYDLLIGLDTLPPRQRQAFELICIQGYTESAATAVMLPNSKWSTPVQQYSDQALLRMVTAYDLKQRGQWPPPAKKRVAPSVPPMSPIPSEGATHGRCSTQRGQLQTRGRGRRDAAAGPDRGDPTGG